MALFPATIDAPVAREYRFDVMAEGAKMDGSDDTDAFERAWGKAVDFITSKGVGAELFVPPGTLNIRRGLITSTPKLSIAGAGKYSSVINMGASYAHPIIFGADRSSGPSAPQYSLASGIPSLVQGIRGSDQYCFDLTQYNACRLSGSWTMGLTLAETTRFAATGGIEYLFFVGGRLYTGQSIYPTVLAVITTDSGDLYLQFRYGGTVIQTQLKTTLHPKLVVGEAVNLEFNWDSAARTLYVYWNGELWTWGAWSPPAGDGSNFSHNPWESMCLGSGASLSIAQTSAFQYYIPSAVRQFHLQDGVKHRTGFTVNLNAPAAPDGTTRLAVNFDRWYKGCVIAKGLGGISDVYLYPTCIGVVETPQTTLHDIGFVGGAGIRGEFTSQQHIYNVFHLYPGDGWQLTRNGYESRYTNIDIIAGMGRAAWLMNGSSYITMQDIRVAAPIGFFFDEANINGCNLTASIHPGYQVGMYMIGGTFDAQFQVDAEETDSAYLAALIAEDPESAVFRGSTLYGPPGSTGRSAVIASMANPLSRLKFDGCSFYQEPTSPIIKTAGTLTTLTHPIVVDTCKNAFNAPLCNVPANVVER